MNTSARAVLVLIPALVVGACAGRPQGPPRAPGAAEAERAMAAPNALLLTSFDADSDLEIDGGELDAGAVREFARADDDGDGALSPFEYNAWAEAALGGLHVPRRLEFDSNVDNSITRAEFEAALRALMQAYDADGDGRIVRAELIRERPRMMAAPEGMRRPPRMPPGGGRRPPMAAPLSP
ncbi:MAG: hypothetical protein GC206_15620 [Alphaproteobacteria bacterium]|nr:hypothetical protein [Alphaproteobacteria bacterium]